MADAGLFIGWGAVGLGLLLERIFRNTIGVLVASVVGSLTLVIAHNIATGDTLEMMQAVLDTNFWLATHVTSVTISYTATFVLADEFDERGRTIRRSDGGYVAGRRKRDFLALSQEVC